MKIPENYDPTEVDLYNLHIASALHPSQYRKALDEVGDIADELSRKNSYYKYMKGQVSLEYATGKRKILDGNDKPLAKPTAGIVSAAVDSDEELYKIQLEINKLEKDLSTAKSYAEAIRQNKYSIENEISLYLSGYFSEPVNFKRTEVGVVEYRKQMEEIKSKAEEEERREEIKRRRKRRDEDE